MHFTSTKSVATNSPDAIELRVENLLAESTWDMIWKAGVVTGWR